MVEVKFDWLLKGYLLIVLLEFVYVYIQSFKGAPTGFEALPVAVSVKWLIITALISYTPDFLLKWVAPKTRVEVDLKKSEEGASKGKVKT